MTLPKCVQANRRDQMLAKPNVTAEEAAWCRISLARVPSTPKDLYETYEMLGIEVSE